MFPSSSLCNGYFARYILLCSLFLISIDLRMPLVSHVLFNSLFCLFDTFWGGAQKFINFSTFLRNSSEDKSTSLQLKCSSVTQSTLSSRELIMFLFFSISWKSWNVCSVLSNSNELCWFPMIKNWAWWSDNVLKRFPQTEEKWQLLVNILSMVYESCWWCSVQVGLKICGRRREEYIKSRK